jgi:serine/threonine protein kinase
MLANADGPGGTGGLSLRLIRRFAEQLLLALAVLRRQGIIHHEVKPENVLLVHPTRSAIKLANFGSSGFAVGKGEHIFLSPSRATLTPLDRCGDSDTTKSLVSRTRDHRWKYIQHVRRHVESGMSAWRTLHRLPSISWRGRPRAVGMHDGGPGCA